ncbi:hypothetical protein ILUMI_05691 [Ignelater luminosus]|uniref:Peptidase S1 domain-containing protein n=1 Tax=Ignelater luminosus TaxID=2038154 RepID=A0A8K0GDB7_IGNLU|nr:hypothetical protein ILUMI_05691 [Ignelater luminosus]
MNNIVRELGFFIINLYSISCSWFDTNADVAEFFGDVSSISISDYPYMASIVTRMSLGGNEFLCSGTIIGQLFSRGIVLTTATCLLSVILEGVRLKEMRVRTNSEYWEGCKCDLLAKEYKIKTVHLHPHFSVDFSKIGENDVAIIVIKGHWKGPYDKTSLNSKLTIFTNAPNDKLYALGWSIKRKPPIESTDLKRTNNLMVIPKSSCNVYVKSKLSEQTFCVTNENIQQYNPCHFNRGGPLLAAVVGNTVLKGIALYAPTCEEQSRPAVLVNISLHGDFLNNLSQILGPDILDGPDRFWDGLAELVERRSCPKDDERTEANETDVKLFFYTGTNHNSYVQMTLRSGLPKEFNASKECLFVIHGWESNYTSRVCQLLKNALLRKRDLNVFVVDWSARAQHSPPWWDLWHKFVLFKYVRAVNAVPLIGQFLGEFICREIISNHNVPPSKVKLIGHSLGAHISGFVGATLKNKCKVTAKYIIGLDPAKPCFTNVTEKRRLNKYDAEFVHIFHTNAGVLGFKRPIGTADYYFNDGVEQPGCFYRRHSTNTHKPDFRKYNNDFYISTSAWIDDEISDRGGDKSCAHSRSYEYLAESFNENCEFIAYSCKSWKDFQMNTCGNKTSYAGRLDIDEM